jgi:hypothetical protein
VKRNCSQSAVFWPSSKNRPTACYACPRGLQAQQPMAGPAKRPTTLPRLGWLQPARPPVLLNCRSPNRGLKTNPPISVVYIRPRWLENPRSFHFSLLLPACTAPLAAAAILPAAGALPAAVRGASRSKHKASSHLSFTFFPYSSTSTLKTARDREVATHGGSVEQNGAAAGPLAVERPRGGAQTAWPARRRGGELLLLKPRTAAGTTRTGAMVPRVGRISLGASISGKKLGSRVWFLTWVCICLLKIIYIS